jgi:hypothetical protein
MNERQNCTDHKNLTDLVQDSHRLTLKIYDAVVGTPDQPGMGERIRLLESWQKRLIGISGVFGVAIIYEIVKFLTSKL